MEIARIWIVLGSFFGFTGVALGAFGAHALKERFSPQAMDWFHTGAYYQMVHALALFAFGVWMSRVSWASQSSPAVICGWAFTLGILLFSGSLYVMAFTGIRVLGAVTPLGGVAFLIAWGLLGFLAVQKG